MIDGQIHYGWARLSVQNVYRGIYDTLTGYAYETIPDKAIITGQTHDSAKATLGATCPRRRRNESLADTIGAGCALT